VAVTSAGQYANHLHLAPDRQPCEYLTTQFLQARCLSCHPTSSVEGLKASTDDDEKSSFHTVQDCDRQMTAYTAVQLNSSVCDYSHQAGFQQLQDSSTANCWSPCVSIGCALHRRHAAPATIATSHAILLGNITVGSNVACGSVAIASPAETAQPRRDVVWELGLGWPREACFTWGCRSRVQMGNFEGQPTVKYMDCLPWAMQKQLNRSRCHFRCRVGWGEGTMY